MATEDTFPTIRDLRDGLDRLVDAGLGNLPVQIIIAPDSTMQAVARVTAGGQFDPRKPALLIEFDSVDGRLPMTMVSVDRMTGAGMSTRTTQ